MDLPDRLVDALGEAKRITNFEGKRRQMQYVGKLMRKLDPESWQAARSPLEEQRNGSATEKAAPAPGRAMARPPDRRRRPPLAAWMARVPDTDTAAAR